MSVKSFLKEVDVFEKYKDVYSLFFVRVGFIQSFYDYVGLKKRYPEIENFLFELSQSHFIKHFDLLSLKLPLIEKKKHCQEISYKKTERMVFLLKNHFYFTLFYLRTVFFFERL